MLNVAKNEEFVKFDIKFLKNVINDAENQLLYIYY